MPSHNIPVGLIGLGYWGRNYLRHFSIVAASDIKTLPLKNTTFYRDPIELINNPHIQTIVIASPAETHFSLGKEALLAGKKCLIEKPLALSYSQVFELHQLAIKQGCFLMPGHQYLYHPAFQLIKQYYGSGKLGSLQHIIATRRNNGVVRSHENVLWSLGPHDLSLIFGITEASFPISIECSGVQLHNNGIEDECSLKLLFKEGFSVHIHLSWASQEKQRFLLLEGSAESILFDDLAPWDKKLYLVKAKRYISIKAEEPMKLMCEAFIREQKPEYLMVYHVLDKAQRSLKASSASLECIPSAILPHALSTNLHQ